MSRPPEYGEKLITAEQMAVSYGGIVAVEQIDLNVDAGEIVTLIGPNGAGKSSIVKALLGLIKPSAGTITRKEGLSIGYAPQALTLDPIMPMKVTRFLQSGRKAAQSELLQALEDVGATHIADKMMHTLSGGEMRRALIARALLQQPQLLILDEPVQGVDAPGQLDLYELIARVAEDRQCGVLIVSHDLHLVMARTHKVLCINGHICCAGTPDSVARDPAYLRIFGPRAAQELAIYTHHHDHHHDDDQAHDHHHH